jgi:hypothetical protein
MVPETTIDKASVGLKIKGPIVTAFIGAIAAIYQYTFWKPFRINILEFVSLADMVKLALWPVIGFAVFLWAGFLLGRISNIGEPLGPVPTELRGFKKLRAFANAFPEVSIGFILTFGLLLQFFQQESPVRWIVLSFWGAFGASIFLAANNSLSTVIANPSLRTPAILTLTFLPWFAWGTAKTNAEVIQRGLNYERVIATPEFRQRAAVPDSAELRYLGNSGSYTILLVDDGPQVIVTRNEDVGPISLIPMNRGLMDEEEDSSKVSPKPSTRTNIGKPNG